MAPPIMFWSDLRNMQHDCGCNLQFCWNLAEKRRGNQSYYLISRVSRTSDPVLWQWDINSSRAGQNIWCCSRQTDSHCILHLPSCCWLLNWVHHYPGHPPLYSDRHYPVVLHLDIDTVMTDEYVTFRKDFSPPKDLWAQATSVPIQRQLV